ncbi:PH and SEC7 domain-containing protein 4 isoform 11-T27 [Hipposideros larvatus]
MMGDDRLSEHPKPMGLLNICLRDDLQPSLGVHPRGMPEPSWEHTWASAPPDPTRPGTPPRGSSAEPMGLVAGPSQGDPRQSQGTSTQVVFWAGILQAQMCVLDLEEELEKTEGLRAGLRSCLPMAPADLCPFSCSPTSPQDLDLCPGPPVEEASGEDSSGPEDTCMAMRPDSPHTLEPPVLVPGSGAPWWLGEDPDGGDSMADSSGHTTPPFPVPTYKSHSWDMVDTTDQAPTAPPGRRNSETTLADGLDPAASHMDKASTWEKGPVGSDPDPATHHVQPWALPSAEDWHTGQGPSWPQVPLISQDRGGAEPSSLERAAPEPGEDVKSEGARQPDVHRTSTEGLPESHMPQVQPPEEGQRPQAGDKLANGIGTDKLAWDLASRLYRLEGFQKSEVAAHLRKNDDLSRAVAQEYLSFFQFGGQSLDHALRGFLQALVLSGETQERERVLYQFSRRFHHCNPGLFSSVDSVHTLTCAIMLLNTDLHGQNIGKSMSCQEFISNLNGLQDGGNFPKELLKGLYWSIRSEKLEWAVDEEDAARPEKVRPSPPAGTMSNPFLQLAHDPTVPTYKQGILARKMHHDADGKKTPWGKRGWKMFHTLLRGMVLYFLKGEDQGPEGQMVDEPVGVHHSLATPATYYTKKPHVFQLRTADWRLYLFQAPTAKEMTSWIARINLAAATHSAPPFPAAIGSQRRFVRPILPAGPTQSSLEEQHRSHENSLDAASDDLLDLQRNFPERRGRSRELEEYRLRKEYLEHEKTRYEMYVQLLVARLHCPSDDLELWEEQQGREARGMQEPKPSLKKSHSSPSLQQDEAPTTAKVKRNISERRTYRKIIPKRNRYQL